VRFRDDNPSDLYRAQAAVGEWREQHPDGSAEQMLADVGPGFHPDYAPVLRAVLFTADRRRARVITGIVTAQAGAAR
jgi:hypothetical protein